MIWRRVALVVVLGCNIAVALCYQPQPRLLRAEYSQSDAVVIAHLVKSQHNFPKDDQDYHLYTFEVDRTLRGSMPPQFVLWDENSSARVTFDIVRGRRYLLFVDRWRDKKKDWWTADGCGHSGDVAQRARVLSEIERITSLQSACIAGEVQGATSGSRPMVVAIRKQDGKRFVTRTSENGTFNLNVPPGEYKVIASDALVTFATSWLSYEHAKKVRLAKGACAQILLVPSGSSEAAKN